MQASHWGELVLYPCDRHQLDSGGWGRGKVKSEIFFTQPLPYPSSCLSFIPSVEVSFSLQSSTARKIQDGVGRKFYEKISPVLQANATDKNSFSSLEPRSFWPAAGIESSGFVQHRKSAIHGLPVKSGKSDWLRTWNEYSAHAQTIGSGQSSRSLPQVRRIVALGTRTTKIVLTKPIFTLSVPLKSFQFLSSI